jgi:hypothetical protein
VRVQLCGQQQRAVEAAGVAAHALVLPVAAVVLGQTS